MYLFFGKFSKAKLFTIGRMAIEISKEIRIAYFLKRNKHIFSFLTSKSIFAINQ